MQIDDDKSGYMLSATRSHCRSMKSSVVGVSSVENVLLLSVISSDGCHVHITKPQGAIDYTQMLLFAQTKCSFISLTVTRFLTIKLSKLFVLSNAVH